MFRVALTMTVSAFWHGVHAGYYLSFLTIPPNLIAEDLMLSAFRSTDDSTQARTFDWVCWFFKMRSFEYMSMSFLLLGFSATLRYWSSIYFIGHVVILMFIVVGYVFRSPRRRSVSPTKSEWTLFNLALDYGLFLPWTLRYRLCWCLYFRVWRQHTRSLQAEIPLASLHDYRVQS